MSERGERALREALGALPPEETVDLDDVRRRVGDRRRRSQVVGGMAVVLVLLAGVIGLPQLIPPSQPQATSAGEQAEPRAERQAESDSGPAAANTPEERAPGGWRTEYYRDISFDVPANWGYAVPPSPTSWCASSRDGKPRPDQVKPYVWLRTSMSERAIACGSMPDSLLTEHVVALEPGPAEDYAEGTSEVAGWSVMTRFAGSAVLIVTTKDRDRAEQILDSATVVNADTPCPPSSPVAGPLGTRPGNATDLAQSVSPDWVVLCQYEPVVDPADAELPRLRATVRLTGSRAQALVTGLVDAPVNDSSCDPAPVDGRPDLAVVARIGTGDRTSDIHIAATGCPDGDRGMAGGIDDGSRLRLLTREACQLVLTPPLALYTGSGDVGRNCLG